MTPDPEQLTAEELRLAATGISMWESEFGISTDDWTEEFALFEKLHRMADALDPDGADTEETQ